MLLFVPNLPRVALIACIAAAAGCEPGAPVDDVAIDTESASTPIAAPTRWRRIDDAQLLALKADADELTDAIAQARASLDDAYAIWQSQQRDAAAPRDGWAVKWRAPTADGGAEYVWVEPLAWSPFRIEGRLASPPQRELQCGKKRDELVGFPAEELVDWVRYANDDFTGTYEGGFTIAALDG